MMSGGLAEKIRRGEPISPILAFVLRLATVVQRLGMWWRRLQPAVKVDAHVISYGNITAGGVGKTPLVIERAGKELAAGNRVAVLTRGYGSARTREPLASSEVAAADRVRALGDEAALILNKLPDVLVVKGRDRVASARHAIDRGCDLLILDDGYQYLRLARDEDVLVIDATLPFGHRALIPRGLLRETLEHMNRATHVVLTRCDQVSPERLGEIENQIRRHNAGAPIRRTVHAPVGLRRLGDGAKLPLDCLRGREIAAACAIGNPDTFRRTLEGLGAIVRALYPFRDHTAFNLESLTRAGRAVPQAADTPERVPPTVSNLSIVITEKDAIRLNASDKHTDVAALEIACKDFLESTAK